MKKNDRRTLAVTFAASAALLLASLLNFIKYQGYPLLRAEVGLVALGLLAVSAMGALFYRAQRQLGRSFLEGLLAAIVVDLNTDSVPIIAAAGLGVFAFTLWRRMSLLGPMAVMGCIMTVLIMLPASRPQLKVETNAAPPPRPDLPAVVHVILDEHVGIEGLPSENPETPQMRNMLKDFYASRGFALYGGAYSQHLHTVNAIPHILNYGRRRAAGSSRLGARTGPTEYFTSLRQRGYQLSIIQPDFVEYCSGNPHRRCTTYGSAGLAPTLDLPWNARERAGLMAMKFVSLSEIAKAVQDPWNIVAAANLRRMGVNAPFLKLHDNSTSSAVDGLQALNLLRNSAATARPGEVFFAHILFPHYPYVVTPDCQFLPWSKWGMRRSTTPITERQSAYFRQLQCTYRKIDEVLTALARSPAGANAIVVIHGDHGSRITNLDPNAKNFGQFSDADMLAGFSTLFAVRAPGIAPRYSSVRVPAASLLGSIADSKFTAAPEPASPVPATVLLDNKEWKPVRSVPLPDWWVKGLDRPVKGQ